MSASIQSQLLLPDVPDEDVSNFIVLEMTRHRESGRKKFLVRVPVDRVTHLYALMLRASKKTKSSLENQLTSITGLENGRTLRRYVSGEAHMAWPTYRRMLTWALAEGWIKDYVFGFLVMESFHSEAAQLALRGVMEKTRRQATEIILTKEEIISAFNKAYRAVELERNAIVVRRAELNSQFKELAIEFDFQFD
ncbi:hypothetical protein QCD83_19880 [Pseudomonas savastanoi pv. phaseolicola]|uniref:Uncharacterized protein n=5 Tax=Pseudomonas syringae group TaxID=136849 RepID=A0AAD0GNU1_9PSED|nr:MULTISPECIES: hypothetical protein [Pseudomonas]AVB18127.1 hypothetical protein BKM03_01685 [Pseudomonas avellanae]EGH08643.1 hypothetical protein PSYMP_07268 [Pseudomonas amygdali pv. morsprunorum str. M302280]KWS70419.1 hypothetical protein AL055_15790 [Pseudomonas amygdali pv. morsprunorum]MDG6381127.1 hypothetical protein [Pseudomonas savastanoi pv. phaseolicola]MDG6391494.1 hypothetical protein [Pseudomonas savastanoi pv. phaseolicola]